ncbi:MAG: hypothetical protein R3F11_01630 [Verrucomicrobiales bacterium]
MKPPSLFPLLVFLFAAAAHGAPLNVTISQLSGNLGAQYLLESDPAHDALHINASARLQRNAGFVLPANVSVRWRATLSVTNGAPIAQVDHDVTYQVFGTHDEIVSESFALDPPVMLADNTSHTLLVEIFHIEDPALRPPTYSLDDDQPLTYLNFPHFSGVLHFGSTATTLTSFGNPIPHYLGGSQWNLGVYTGELANGTAYANSPNSTPIAATRDPATGDLAVDSGSAEIAGGSGPFTLNGWEGERGAVLISAAGIAAQSFTLELPNGIGWRDGTGGALNPVFSGGAAAMPLDESLAFAGPVGGAFPPGREFIGPCLAVSFTPPSWTFDGQVLELATPGTRFLRRARYQEQLTATGALPRSNDSYLFFLRNTAGSSLQIGTGGMTVALQLQQGAYTTHFPDGDVGGRASTIRIADDAVDPASSSIAADWVHLQYDKGCPQVGGDHHQGMRILAPDITFTPQGGIAAAGALATDAQFPGVERHLEVGLNAGGNAVHETDDFAEASFYAPGPVAPVENPAAFLLAETQPDSGYALGLPGTPAYEAGRGWYAGFNFFYPENMPVRSRVGGESPFDYAVFDQKAYARWWGVSGIIEALPAELPFQASIYGFPIGFTDWGFNFLGNEMRDSYIDGQVDLTGTYADFVQGMEEVRISCCGNLESFEIPGGEEAKRLGYWDNFEIRNSSARFVTPGACDDSRACLSYVSTAEINGLTGRHAGELCFLPDGSMTVPSDPDFAASHLALAPQGGLAGQYYLWPRGDAYFNNPHQFAAGPGFVTAAGDIETPYFTLTPIRFQTTAVPEVDDEVLVGFIHGDFLPPGAEDAEHRGMPGGMTPQAYRASVAHQPTAEAPFFGKLNAFDFPVIHNLATGNFHSPQDKEADLIVANFDAGIDRLNAEFAQIHFGAEIEGLTQMTVGSLLEEAAEYGAQGVAQAIGDNVTGPIKDGLLSLAEMLDNRVENLLTDAVDRAVDATVVEPLTQALRTMEANKPDWNAADLDAELAIYFAPGGPLENAIASLQNFEDGAGDIATVIGTLRNRLDRVYEALDCIVMLLDGNAADHSALGALYTYAVEQLQLNPDIGALDPAVVDGGWQSILSNANAGWLADAREAVAKLRDLVGGTRDLLQVGQDFFDEIGNAFGNAAQVLAVINDARFQLRARLLTEMPGQVLDFSPEEIGDRIKGAIKDRLFGSVLSVDLQSILRARLGYLDTLINDAINTAMQAFTKAVIEALEESGVLDALNTALETFSDAFSYQKAARVNGEAITYSDRLKDLTIQSEVEFGIPTPIGLSIPMSADAMLKYVERVADGASPCSAPASAVLPEVTLKASAGTAIGFGLDSRATIALKFGFEEDYTPTGFAGAFQIHQSQFAMNSMGMNDFSGVMALGGSGAVPEYYLSAHAGGSFGAGGTSVDLEGGFCIGQFCDAQAVAFYPNFPLPPGPGEVRRGLVAYLEGKAPIIGSSCLFNVTVGAQIGAYALADGANNPFFGGKLGGSISGEVLCLLKAGGEIDLGYGYGGGVHQFDGSATAEIKLGFKPFQIKKSKTLSVEYTKPQGGDGQWDVNP